jgi:hypothetical protein
LPKATVKLQPTGSLSKGAPTTALKPPSASAVSPADEGDDYEYVEEEGGQMPFAVIVLILSVVVLIIEVLTKMSAAS